jgi:phage shock protein A
MNDLFKKLNVLMKAKLNDVLEAGASSRERPSTLKLGPDVEREIGHLRARIEDALRFEDELVKRTQDLQAEIDRWDTQADQAVAAGDDASARYAVEQMQRSQRSLGLAEADLREHRTVTQELILRVNMLDAAVADARRAQAEKAPAPAPAQEPADDHSMIVSRTKVLSESLRDIREQAAQAAAPTPASAVPEPPAPDRAAVEDDLERRLKRLRKPE